MKNTFREFYSVDHLRSSVGFRHLTGDTQITFISQSKHDQKISIHIKVYISESTHLLKTDRRK